MSWNSVVGQHSTIRLLQHAIAHDRMPHALVLSGEDGYGTLAVALAVARCMTCENVTTSASLDACGTCHSCIQASTLQHPNIKLVCALPSGKADVESELAPDVLDELAHQLRTIAEDPYETFGLADATQIRISQIRELKRELAMSAAQAGWRVVIIHHADEMTVEASNAFLKTLEEPHHQVLLILTTASPERLLQTITSRCQTITLSPLDDDDVVTALVEQGVNANEAAIVASFAEGNLATARSYLNEDLQAERAEAIDLLRTALRGKGFRGDLVEAVANQADKRDRKRALRTIRLLALWLRDVQSVLLAGAEAPIVNIDQREAVQKFAAGFGSADLVHALDLLETAARDIRRNVSVQLTLLTMLMDLRSLFHSAVKTASA